MESRVAGILKRRGDRRDRGDRIFFQGNFQNNCFEIRTKHAFFQEEEVDDSF